MKSDGIIENMPRVLKLHLRYGFISSTQLDGLLATQKTLADPGLTSAPVSGEAKALAAMGGALSHLAEPQGRRGPALNICQKKLAMKQIKKHKWLQKKGLIDFPEIGTRALRLIFHWTLPILYLPLVIWN